MLKRPLSLLIFPTIGILLSCTSVAQQHSENGWALPAHDTLRVLMLFIEVDYDTLANLADLPNGSDAWKVGQLPNYADSIFDPFYNERFTGQLSQYYAESSLGNLIVLGDYYPRLIKVPYSQMLKGQTGALFRIAAEEIEKDGAFISAHGLEIKDFDRWSNSKGRGLEITRSGADFEGVDHVMVLTRNYHKFPNASGQASPSSFGMLGGKRSDTYSIFSGGHSFPFSILKHELNHLFLGGNNFHSGGGNSPRFKSYFLSVQGGWSMMGGSNSSFLTCSGWDRYRLGWKATENQHLISARDSMYNEVNGDLDATNPSDAGVYILRDFQTTGDAIRIKLPFIPEGQFGQWLWLENHTTWRMNGSPFDRFNLEEFECTSYSESGLYMLMQVDADMKKGENIYNQVNADYLRPVLANGNYDMRWSNEKVSPGFCVNGQAYHYYELLPELENPLSGSHEQEQPLVDLKENPGQIDPDEVFAPMIKKTKEGYSRLDFMGNKTHAFRKDGNSVLGIGTNPSSASMSTFVNARREVRNPDKRNNNQILLNGIRVEILKRSADGTLEIQIRFDDNEIESNRRWCGSAIVLNDHHPMSSDLIVKADLILDRGLTTTRFGKADTVGDIQAFSDPTRLYVNQNAEMAVAGKLIIAEDSELYILKDGKFDMHPKSRAILQDMSRLYVHDGAELSIGGRIRIRKGSMIYCESEADQIAIRRATRQKKRVELSPRKAHIESAP